MHVMHVIDSLAVGGAERMLVEIANATHRLGVGVSVCATRELGPMRAALCEGIPVRSLDRRSRFDLVRGLKIRDPIRHHQADLLHVHGRNSFRFASMAKSLGAVRIPIVLHDHEGTIDIDSSIPKWFRAAARRHLGAYVGVCQALGDWAVAVGVEASKVHVIANALDLERLQRSKPALLPWPLARRPQRVGIVVAGLRPEKGIRELIQAFGQLEAELDLGIVIVGGARDAAYVTDCHALVKSLGLGDRICFVGEQPDAAAMMKAADFGVIPSLAESGPLTLIEMLALGLPLVATKTGAIAHIAAASGVVGIVAPGDVAALSQEIGRIGASSEAELKTRGDLNSEIAHREFNIDVAMPKWMSVYQQAIG